MGLFRRRRATADTDYDYDRTTTTTAPVAPGRLAMPRSRGFMSGLLLVILGAIGGLAPFVGPYFNLSIGSDQAWDYSSGRLWLSILPAAATVLGGLMLMYSANRATATFGSWLALAGGVWFVIGPVMSMLWNGGQMQTGQALGGTNHQVAEWLVYFYGVGAAITAVAGIALGRVTTRSVRDVERLTPDTVPVTTTERTGRFSRRPATTTEPVDEPATVGAGPAMRHTDDPAARP
jgi:hypothetical protein